MITRPFDHLTLAFVLTYSCCFLFSPNVSAQSANQNREHRHEKAPLHFAHPLFTESPFPDNKVRVDYLFTNRTGEGGEAHTPSITGEVRWTRNLSTEVKLPYTVSNPDEGANERRLDNSEVAIKYANFTFEEQGVLIGGGLEVGLPTGDDEVGIGSDHLVEIEPFVNVGYKPDEDWEIVGRLAVGHTANENDSDPADHEVAWNASVLYHATTTVKPNVEAFGERVSGGEEDGLSTANVALGVKLVPFAEHRLKFGLSGAVPVSDDKEADSRILFSTFYHF